MPKSIKRLKGDLSYRYEVVGESFYQDALQHAARGRKYREPVYVTAVLVPEPNNVHDPHAVRVDVDGRQVGYLPRGQGQGYIAALRQHKLGDVVECLAQIRGGWQSGDDIVWYGIWLDLPDAIAAAPARAAALAAPAKKRGCGCLPFSLGIVAVLIALVIVYAN